MANETLNQVNKQVETLFVDPARSYAGLALDHFEQLANAQYEATQAYAEAGLKQARAVLDIRQASDVQAYVENQQKLAKDLSERLKGDAEKFVAISQDFAQKTQKLTEASVQNVSKVVAKGK
ncbi:MAG: phasin family protein [Aquisalimonadaceae bacterium]